jgi:hypothetical protein
VADAHRERDDHGAADQHLLDRESGGRGLHAYECTDLLLGQAAQG